MLSLLLIYCNGRRNGTEWDGVEQKSFLT